ncbi:hypothetical protein BD293_4418 [Roseinatronobacter monicus]|uniref:Uncharacterized protein n=1 Tax=Roseinatronobacter monicus TaxID=393481 RepID=A0A543K3S1_9RHOB|nr:hypothetical protein BD293_4418 [Roseinatronobacter monicus]
MYSAEQSGRGRSPTHGPERDCHGVRSPTGAARSEARTRVGDLTTRLARRLPLDRLDQVCWADKKKEECQRGR